VHAGNPAKAYEEAYRLSVVWKKPFERNLIGATQAVVAACVQEGATVESVTETLFRYAGPLARKLLERAQRIAQAHEDDPDGFIEGIYAEALVAEGTRDIDGPMRPSAVPDNPYRGATTIWAEQIPLAFAALLYGKGDFVKTMTSCVSLGRDTDSIASTCGSWIGGLVGLDGIPAGWVETIQQANLRKIDRLGRSSRLANLVVH
jgi:ADP-ribosylglycohydrolase